MSFHVVACGWFFEKVFDSFFNGYPPIMGMRQLWVTYGTVECLQIR